MTEFIERVNAICDQHECQHPATKAAPGNTRVCCECGAQVNEGCDHDEFEREPRYRSEYSRLMDDYGLSESMF